MTTQQIVSMTIGKRLKMTKIPKSEARKLDDAARAGWLYYVGGKTQEEIAKSLNVSRQTAQRMVALSVSEGLIKVRLEHPIAKCMDLKRALMARFGLAECIVVPSELGDENSTVGLAQAGANEIERYLKSETPKVLAMGTGRVLKACAEELGYLNCSQHKIVALLGNMASDGSASPYNVVVQMAEHVNAKHYPMPLPVIPKSKAEKQALHSQSIVEKNLSMASRADVTFVGVGNLAINSPLHIDGFVTELEVKELIELGAVGEVIGWVFDANGEVIKCDVNDRVASTPLQANSERIIYGIAAGKEKVDAIHGALSSNLLNGLITNEYTAEQLLAK